MHKTPVMTISVIILLLIGLSLYGLFAALHPPKLHTKITPAQFGVKYDNIEFKTDDGVTLRGWYIPTEAPGAPAVILAHGYGGDAGDILSTRIFLNKHYNLLFFNFRYFGDSDGSYTTAGVKEIKDIEAATQYLKKKGIKQVAVWGLSMGAATALMAAQKQPMIKGIISEASYARLSLLANDYFAIPVLRYPLGWMLRYWAYLYFGKDIDTVTPEKVSRSLQLPIFYMHSKDDELVAFEHLLIIKEAAKENPQASYYIYDQLKHGQLPLDYKQRIRLFLDKAFKPGSPAFAEDNG